MKILQIAAGNFCSTYGGGQVYVKNLVDELIYQRKNICIISFVPISIGVRKKEYHNIELYEVGHSGMDELKLLIQAILPDVIHAHSQKSLITQIGQELHIPVIVTAHHGGILCPVGTLMNNKDHICRVTISHQNCLSCYLRNIYGGKFLSPFMHLLPLGGYLKIGKQLENIPFIPLISPVLQTALSIARKQEEWQNIMEGCTCMIAPSYAIKEAMVRNGISEDKVSVIPHGIPLPKCELNTQFIMKDRIKFFFVGRICYVKGIHILLKAFDQIDSRKVELHLIGGTGNKTEKRYLDTLQRKYASNTNVIWHGKVNPDEIFDLIQEYQILVHTTICLEVFGLNIAEALAMGKPVLATRCGGAEMQIENGVNGWLVRPNDVDDLTRKMNAIVQDNSFISRIESKSRVITIGEHCKTLLDLYKNVMQGKNEGCEENTN